MSEGQGLNKYSFTNRDEAGVSNITMPVFNNHLSVQQYQHWLRHLLRLILILILLIAAGCDHFETRPLQPEQGITKLEQRTLDDPSLRSFMEANLSHKPNTWPPDWGLNSLTLAALFYHPELDVARAQWQEAKAGQISAGERPNPTVAITPGYNSSSSIPTPWIFTAPLDIPIETAGKRGYRMDRAAHLADAARLQLAEVAWQIRSGVRSSLLDLYAANEQASLLRQQQSIQADYVRILNSQYQAGAISAYVLNQARITADSVGLSLQDAERQRQQALVKLAQAVGITGKALAGVKLTFQDVNHMPGNLPDADARRQALLHRSDILRSLAEYAASQSALQLEIAKQYPDINLGPGYEYDQGDNKWSLGISVTLPVFHQNQGAIAEARARRSAAAARFEALQARVLAEIDIAVAGYRTALEKQSAADVMLNDMQQQQRAAQAMFANGEISRSDLDQRRLQLITTELTRLDALVKAQQAAGQLEDALQSPLDLPDSLWQSPPRRSTAQRSKG